MSCLRRFADVVVDLERVAMVVGDKVFLENGQFIGVGGAAADAIRRATPVCPEPGQDTRGTGRTATACQGSGSERPAQRASEAQERLECPSSSITSFLRESPVGEEHGTKAEKKTMEKEEGSAE